jgi:DegV family protein with EDD domain
MSVTIITDSAASLPADVVDELGIVVVPMAVNIGDTTYPDGALTLEEVMRRTDEGVSTSGANPGDIARAIEAAGGDVVVLTVSREMSSTFNAATMAAQIADGCAEVIDTGTAAGAEGLVVLAAARAASLGKPLDRVVTAAREVIERVRLIATVQDLDRLVASGRVPGIAGLANRWLGLQPLFEFRDGGAKPLRPAFSRDAALDRILDGWRATIGEDALHVVALHADAPEDAERLLKQVVAETPAVTAFVAPFSAVMVAHTGLGLVGLAWWWEDAERAATA